MSDAVGTNVNETLAGVVEQQTTRVSDSEMALVQADASAQSAASTKSSIMASKQQAQATLDNPPTIPVTESDKKGSTTTHQVDENAVRQAEQQLAQLESDIAAVEQDLQVAKEQVSSAEGEMLEEQAVLAEATTQLSTLSEAEDIASKLIDTYQGEDGYLNRDMEDAYIERLNELVETISEWGDLDGNGSNDGEAYANAIDSFLNGENGFYDTRENREYESDYIARGEIPPWQQTGSGDDGDAVSAEGLATEDEPEYVEVDVVGGDTLKNIRNSVQEAGNNAVQNDLDVY